MPQADIKKKKKVIVKVSEKLEPKNDTRDDISELLKENIAMNKEILAMVRHINVYVAWQRIFGWLKFLLILIPIIIGVLYLPPFIKDAYQELINIMKTNAGL